MLEEDFNALFDQWTIVEAYELYGYPDLRENTFPDILLESGLYYVNAMESLASATELEALAAKNIANLVLKGQAKPINTDL